MALRSNEDTITITFKHSFEWDVTPHSALEKHSWKVNFNGANLVDENGEDIIYFNKDDAWKDILNNLLDCNVIVKNEEVRCNARHGGRVQ